jgi:hypothetical protein
MQNVAIERVIAGSVRESFKDADSGGKSAYFFDPAFLLALASCGVFFTSAFFLPVTWIFAGLLDIFGLATSMPVVTGAFSCSAALGVASADALEKIKAVAASNKCVFKAGRLILIAEFGDIA